MTIRDTNSVPAVSVANDKAASSRSAPVTSRTPAPATVAPPIAAQVTAQTQKTLQKTMQAVAEQLQAYLRSVDRDVELSVDAESGQAVIRVRDGATGDVIRQMPTEEALHILHRLNASSGTLLDLSA